MIKPMIICEIEYPIELIKAIRNNRLVVFAGAGVSIGEPTRLPNFKALTETILEGTGFDCLLT